MRSALAALLLAFGVSVVPLGAALAEPMITDLELTIVLNPGGGLDPIVIPGTVPAAATVARNTEGMLTQVGFASGVVATEMLRVPVTDPAASPIGGLQFTGSNGPASFAGSPLGGNMPIIGVSKVCLFQSTCGELDANLTVPLSVIGTETGSTFVTGTAAGQPNLTVRGAPWTTGMATLGTEEGGTIMTTGGTSVVGTATNMVSLVTPIFISTSLPAQPLVPSFAFLDFTVTAPEPTALAALGTAIAGLVAVGFVRRRSG